MKILAFAASAREASFNRRLIKNAADILRQTAGIELDLRDFREFEMPLYDGDLEERAGIPAGAQALITRIRAADAIVIATPEYNGGIPGTLKNALDWVSRDRPIPFESKPLLLVSASPGNFGGVRGFWHTRVPFEVVGTYVYPETFGLARAHQAFDERGQLKEPRDRERLAQVLSSTSFTRSLAASAQIGEIAS